MTRHSNPEKYVRGYLHYGFIPRSCPKYLLLHDAVTTNPDSRLHKKRKPSFFSNNINIYSINNIICTLVDQIPFIAYKSQSEVTKKKNDLYMISSPREEFAGVSKCLMSLCVRGNGGVKYVITSP